MVCANRREAAEGFIGDGVSVVLPLCMPDGEHAHFKENAHTIRSRDTIFCWKLVTLLSLVESFLSNGVLDAFYIDRVCFCQGALKDNEFLLGSS